MRSLWVDDPSSFAGEFYTLDSCHLHPKPVQQPHPPIHVSGHSAGALHRAATIGQGWYGWYTNPAETADLVEDLKTRLVEQGRDISELQITVTPPDETVFNRETLAAYERAGVNRLLPDVTWPRDVPLSDVLEPVIAAHRLLASR
jgi:alkanesulfonate monooxygenase SsuD/methylene tetrahydromethanopterin reductase-like flavin-dependent oxidoreductase (luciferase family)